MRILLVFLFSFFFVVGNSQETDEYGELPDSIKTRVFFKLNDSLNLYNSELLGAINYRDYGYHTKYCSFKDLLNQHKLFSRKIGANIIYIEKIEYPKNSYFKLCYGFNAKYYRNINQNVLNQINLQYEYEGDKSELVNKSIVYIYRPKLKFLKGQKLKVKLNDSIVCNLRNGTICKLEFDKEGIYIFKGKREKMDSATLNIEMGKKYFIRGGLEAGTFGPRPDFEIVDKNLAEFEMKFVENNN